MLHPGHYLGPALDALSPAGTANAPAVVTSPVSALTHGPHGPDARLATTAAPRPLLARLGDALALRDRALGLLLPLAVLALWTLASRHEWIAPQVLPAPGTVWDTLVESIVTGELWPNLWISLLRVLGGFGIGLVAGVSLGVAMGLSPTLRDYLYPTFKAFAQVPVLGWLPFLMLLVGIDEALKLILISKAAFVPIALNTYKGIQGVPTRLIEVGKVLAFSRWQQLTRIVFPAAIGQVWTGVRYGLTHAWLALVVVELLASSEGIGFMIVYGRQLFQLDVVLAAVCVVGVCGYLIDKGLAAIERRLMRWRREAF